MDNVEMAQESLEHAHPHDHAHDQGAHGHAGGGEAPKNTRRAAVLVAIFASIAVIIEMSANDAQTAYLAHTITASDLWNEYQAKSVRRTIWTEGADALSATTSLTPAIVAATARARAEAARMNDDPVGGGMKQLAARAHGQEEIRDHAHHLHVQLERGVRILQIAIVLTGLYLATRLGALMVIGALLGAGSIAWAVVVALGLV